MRSSVAEGKAGEVKALLREAIDLAKEKEVGLLSYEFFFDETESEMYALELYKDSGALGAKQQRGSG
jgi:quinol monooxygenase YgiN